MSNLFVWVRHCNESALSKYKPRPNWFDKRRFFSKLHTDCKRSNIPLSVVFDGTPETHFVNDFKNINIHPISKKSAAWSYKFMLDLACKNTACNMNDIVYFTEDDYFHRPGWITAITNAFESTDADYVTLYDHPDKYFHYPGLQSEIFKGEVCYWRTVPSTTDTFATRLKTLLEDKDILTRYCDFNTNTSKDHQRFLHLKYTGRKLVSALPAFSTHVEEYQLSPFINWERELTQFSPGSPACGTTLIEGSELSHSVS
jgi:glycosyltransferase involved in cell wall biosynthesis